MKRRDFLAAAACAPLLGCAAKAPPPLPPGELLGMSADLGHRLRRPDFPAPTETRRVPVLIVGAGVGGLSAGWKLERAGFTDFLLLELEREAGGNARYGENAVSAYPWGAHYLPLPTREATAVRELLAELGVLQGDPQAARPSYDERFLCHSPQERVYADGIWQEGLLPKIGTGRQEREQIARFQARMAEFRDARDGQGRRAFAIPLACSSPDRRWRELDRITLAQWLRQEGFDSPRLLWYLDYCCRDDFGTSARETSAWAGIHYFACRNGEAANAGTDAVLTAPEGNGWIVRRLREGLGPRLVTDALAVRLRQDGRGAEVDVWLAAEKRGVRYRADQVIWAAPLFVLAHVAEGLPVAVAAVARRGEYAPWLVANLTLREPPAQGAGAPLSWDNVLYGAPGLGYVVATHQNLQLRPGPTVLTYYRALADRSPRQAREALLTAPRQHWAEGILGELSRAHADLRALTARLDVFRHGHAMIRPTPGVVWDAARQGLAQGWGRVRFAHADASGMSLFEEANYRGVAAAEAVMSRLRLPFTTSLA